MFGLGILKKKRKNDAVEGNTSNKRSASIAYFRIKKDIRDIELPKTCHLHFSDPDDLLNFKLIISPDEGFYKKNRVTFLFNVTSDYPYEPPKVKCVTEIYHPNIDKDGNVCLNILRQDWKPVLTINSIVYGLQYLLLEPNAEDYLNETAAKELSNDRKTFARNVSRVMTGKLRVADISCSPFVAD